MKGAIDHIRVNPETSEITWSISELLSPGICGSGIIDLAVAMVQTEALDFAGKLNFRHRKVQSSPEGLEYILVPASGPERQGIVITQQDIDYLMDSKAAACGAIAVLLKRYKCTVGDVRHLLPCRGIWRIYRYPECSQVWYSPQIPCGNGSCSGERFFVRGIRNACLDPEPERCRGFGAPYGVY